MKLNFFYDTEDEKKELEHILTVECKNHFDKYLTDIVKWSITEISGNNFQLYLNDVLFIKDLQKMKESVYKQNGCNGWHDLVKNPKDLPDTDRHVLVKRHAYADSTFEEVTTYCDKKSWNDEKAEILAWKEIEADEVLLNDFMSDVEENYSRCLKMTVC